VAPRVAAVQCNEYGKFQRESGDGSTATAPWRAAPCRAVLDPV